ncbi:hypothetical protein P7C73_g5961, partial [Tremellales sp. Uapishka_1]
MKDYLDITTKDALSKGLTGIHDAGATPREIDFFQNGIWQSWDGRLTVKAVKLYADGALGSRGAALLDDYSDSPGWKGIMRSKEEIWGPLVKEFYDNGWQVNVHTIGDRANHIVLNAMEAAIASDRSAGRERRLRLEHAQIMTVNDLERAARLGIIASYQPTHATSDMWYAEDRLVRLDGCYSLGFALTASQGTERMKGAYAWQSYLRLGGRITLGSDFPVESIDPLKGFYAAVSRRSEDGRSPHGISGWYPDEKLTREQALRGMTTDAAYASFSNITGSLTKGRRFDAVVWDDDLMSVSEDEMLEVRVKTTIIDGQIVFGAL